MRKEDLFEKTFKLVNDAGYFDALKKVGFPTFGTEEYRLQFTEQNGFVIKEVNFKDGSLSQGYKIGESAYTNPGGKGGATKNTIKGNKLIFKQSSEGPGLKKANCDFEYEFFGINNDKLKGSISYSHSDEDGKTEAGVGIARFEEAKE